MDDTELRQAFFAEVVQHPYSHMLARMWSEAWVLGYEKALKDVPEEVPAPRGIEEVEAFRYSRSHSERMADAAEYLTESKNRTETEYLMALAAIGERLENPLIIRRVPKELIE